MLIDTAGPVVGIAAWGKRDFVASERIVAGADGWLTPALSEALDAAGAVDRIGVVVGPGTFTGLRVGIAHALGLALALGVGVVPVSSLALRAAAVPGHARVLALLDARKGKVYAGWFDTRGAVPVHLGTELDVTPDTLLSSIDSEASRGSFLTTGEGALVYSERWIGAGMVIVPDPARSPVAAGRALVDGGTIMEINYIRPVYIRDPDAKPSAV